MCNTLQKRITAHIFAMCKYEWALMHKLVVWKRAYREVIVPHPVGIQASFFFLHEVKEYQQNNIVALWLSRKAKKKEEKLGSKYLCYIYNNFFFSFYRILQIVQRIQTLLESCTQTIIFTFIEIATRTP